MRLKVIITLIKVEILVVKSLPRLRSNDAVMATGLGPQHSSTNISRQNFSLDFPSLEMNFEDQSTRWERQIGTLFG